MQNPYFWMENNINYAETQCYLSKTKIEAPHPYNFLESLANDRILFKISHQAKDTVVRGVTSKKLLVIEVFLFAITHHSCLTCPIVYKVVFWIFFVKKTFQLRINLIFRSKMWSSAISCQFLIFISFLSLIRNSLAYFVTVRTYTILFQLAHVSFLKYCLIRNHNFKFY